MPLQAGQSQAPDAAGLHAQRARTAQQQEGRAATEHRQRRQSTQHDGGQRHIQAVGVHQPNQCQHSEPVVEGLAGAVQGQVAAQHAQRPERAQPAERRPGRDRDTDQRGERADRVGARLKQRRRYRKLIFERAQRQRLKRPGQYPAGNQGDQPDDGQTRGVQPADAARGRAEAFQQGHGVLVPLGVTARRKGGGDAGQQHRQASGQKQKSLGFGQRFAHRRLRGVHALQTLPRRQA